MIKKWKFNILYIYQVLILLTPILNSYLLIPVKFIYLVCGFGIILFLIQLAGKKIQFSGKVLIYIVYVLLFAVVLGLRTEDVTISQIFARLLYFLLIVINFYIFAYQIWNYEKCFRLYKILCCFFSVLIIIQFISGYLGMGFSLVLPGVTTNTGDLMPSNDYRMYQVLDKRFSTFFLEPAHQAQYCLPCLALVLFSAGKNKKKLIITALLLSGGLIATTSMQGILGTGIIWTVYFAVLVKQKKINGFLRLVVLMPAILVALYFLWNQPVLQEQFQKKLFSYNQGDISKDSSLYVRMIYGWDCYKELNLFHKFFGYGYSNSGTYLLSSGIGLQFTTIELISYMSGMSKMFCELGVVGVVLNFRVMLFPLMRKHNGKRDLRIIGILITEIIIMFTADTFDSMSSLLPLIFALSLHYNKNKGDLYNVAVG